ncbi:MAG: hypothetical protein QMC38_18910, partial [Sinobacterium sp.]
GDKTAHWQGEKRDNTFMDGCFACHSLRAPLTDGFKANKPFLDQFVPQLLSPPNYYVDGQIKEEVYVYGSFLQSKMFATGVNCLDCHDKHTMKLKLEGNGLCLQCHSASEYNLKLHHQHQQDSAGAQCVNCHMPENRYMGVDDRRDHGFKIPRAKLSLIYGTPNACTQCHEDKSNQWASDNLEKWHGKAQGILPGKQLLMKLLSGQRLSLAQHVSIIADDYLDVISRATALQLLAYTSTSLSFDVLSPYLNHSEPLLRLGAATVAGLLPVVDKIKHLSPLLRDKYKAIRVAAARSLVSSDLSAADQPLFDKAFKELIQANEINSWRGEGLINQAMLAIEMNNLTAAEGSTRKAIEIDPYFDAGYMNLADVYRAQQRPLQVASVLSKGIENSPRSAALYYSYGLHYVRQKDIEKALPLFEKAMTLESTNSQFAYTYILALDGAGQSSQAVAKLKDIIINYRDKTELKKLGLYLSEKLNLRSEYDWFTKL